MTYYWPDDCIFSYGVEDLDEIHRERPQDSVPYEVESDNRYPFLDTLVSKVGFVFFVSIYILQGIFCLYANPNHP